MSVLEEQKDDATLSFNNELSALKSHNKSLEQNNKSLEQNNKSLEQNNKSLEQNNKSLHKNIKSLEQENYILREALKIAQSSQYGRSTEKNTDGQLSLNFDTIEEIKDAVTENLVTQVPAHTRNKKSNPNLNGRVELPEDLPREDIYLDIPESEKTDAKTGKALIKIGEDITEQLAIKDVEIYVKRYIRPKYAVKKSAISGIKTEPLPAHHLNRCKADISTIVYLINNKFVNYLPLYRQKQMFDRWNINIPESTMNDWVNNTALVLEDLWKTLGTEVKNSDFINVDDTPLDVLFPDNKSEKSKRKAQIAEGHLWCYRSSEKKLVWFDFSQSWKSSVPFEQLKNFNGYVQSDGYAGFKKISNATGTIIPVGCWVHARRYFLKANTLPNIQAQKFINYINILYRIEHKIKEFRERNLYDEEQLFALRKKRATRVMNKFFNLLKSSSSLPKSALGKAIGYALNHESSLRNYILDMRITPDNNAAENAIRPVTLARKNFLFVGSPRAGKNTAIFMSLAESCKANNVNFVEYLISVLPQLSIHQTNTTLINLLPKNFKN